MCNLIRGQDRHCMLKRWGRKEWRGDRSQASPKFSWGNSFRISGPKQPSLPQRTVLQASHVVASCSGPQGMVVLPPRSWVTVLSHWNHGRDRCVLKTCARCACGGVATLLMTCVTLVVSLPFSSGKMHVPSQRVLLSYSLESQKSDRLPLFHSLSVLSSSHWQCFHWITSSLFLSSAEVAYWIQPDGIT